MTDLATPPDGSATGERLEDDLAQQIVYAVSHDLRAPTRHVHAFVELLSEHLESDLDPVGAGYLARLSGAADVFERKLDALTRYAQVVTGGRDPQRCSADDALSEAVSLLESEIAETGATIIAGPLPIVYADPRQLVTVLTELIGNSLKFCPPGATISVATGAGRDRSTIVVADDGPGFRARDAEAAFELFRRFHGESVPGTGTGLAIVERIVHRNGGRVAIDPSVAGGSRIVISLPSPGPAPIGV